MRKLFICLMALTVFLLSGCTEYVKDIKKTEKKYGVEYTFYAPNQSIGNTYYEVYIPDIVGNPYLKKTRFPTNHSEPIVEKIENVTIGNIVKINGEIKSLVINGQKYEAF